MSPPCYVTEVGTTTFYAYDFDNRLTQSSIWNGTGTTTTTYAYDPFGNRISQTASTTTTLYPSKYYSITTTTTGTSTVATSTDYLYSDASLLGTVDQKMVSAQKIIRVEQSKGRKDRNVMLSPDTLDLLRQ
jgi:YD repeat-containing protein